MPHEPSITNLHAKPNLKSADRQQIMRARFSDPFSGVEDAKRVRTNTTKAVSAIKEILGVLKNLTFDQRLVMADDWTLLTQAANLLSGYSRDVAAAQKSVACERASREKSRKEEYQARIARMVIRIFGMAPEPLVVKGMAADLLKFQFAIVPWAQQLHHVDEAFISIHTGGVYDALRFGNVTEIALAVAEECARLPVCGKSSWHKGLSQWEGGWEDFIAWHTSNTTNQIGALITIDQRSGGVPPSCESQNQPATSKA
ncbi:hypothetical protein [Propionivibrio sp.]|uniref:hypothetical protein n=1 Tax=Propionivibrio sp. TaxID=2212460 RepID=UPI003BF39ED2